MATTLRQLISDEDIAAFHRDGAVQLKGVLPDEYVSMVADGLDFAYENPDGYSTTARFDESALRIDQFPAARSAKLRQFIDESPVAEIVGTVMGEAIRFYMDQMFYKPAGELLATAWHQDTCYYNMEGDGLIRAWVSPDHVPLEASLEVVRGSHRWNVTYRPTVGRDPDMTEEEIAALKAAMAVNMESGDTWSYGDALLDRSLPEVPLVAENRDSFDVMGWTNEPGDVILFHGNILHGAPGAVTLDHDRRAHASMWAGSDLRYVHRFGQVIPDPVALTERNPQDGQTLADFPEIFPVSWQP